MLVSVELKHDTCLLFPLKRPRDNTEASRDSKLQSGSPNSVSIIGCSSESQIDDHNSKNDHFEFRVSYHPCMAFCPPNEQ